MRRDRDPGGLAGDPGRPLHGARKEGGEEGADARAQAVGGMRRWLAGVWAWEATRAMRATLGCCVTWTGGAGRGGGFWAGSGGREAGWVLFGSGLVVGLLWVFTFLFLFLFYVSLKLNLFEFKNKFRIQTPMKSNN